MSPHVKSSHKESLLKLAIKDQDDLLVLSSLLQDATVLIGDMGYDADRGQFMMVAARYCHDEQDDPKDSIENSIKDGIDAGRGHRRLIGINFDQIKGLKRKGFSPNDSDDVLNLLAIQAEDDHIDMIFAGAAMLRLECDAIRVYAADLGEGWSTGFEPKH